MAPRIESAHRQLCLTLWSSVCPCSSSLLGWCCHSAIILFFLCFLRSLSSLRLVRMQESWSFHAAQNEHAKSFFFSPSRTCTLLFLITGVCGTRTRLILPPCWVLSWTIKASSDCRLELYHSRPVKKPKLQERSCWVLPSFSSLAETEYAFLVGELGRVVVFTWHFPRLVKSVYLSVQWTKPMQAWLP